MATTAARCTNVCFIIMIAVSTVLMLCVIRRLKYAPNFRAIVDSIQARTGQNTTDEDNTNPPRISPIPERWQRVGGSNLYVFSAYYKEDEHIVKIIGMLPKNEFTKRFKVSCVLKSKTQGTLEVANYPHRPV